jgi:bifunctional DNA-binding transcriptional regulator/antitoxin component of YhaV-PrlF toxin-antitoxin module
MSKVTSKLQVTIPKAVALEHDIHPGSDITFVSDHGDLRILPPSQGEGGLGLSTEERLALFDAVTARQTARDARRAVGRESATLGRGWRREALYDRVALREPDEPYGAPE